MPEPADPRIPAIGYIRVSLAREEMISPALQRTAIEAWALRSGRRIVDWVVDLDATGRNFKRKVMQAIGFVEDGTAKEIAAWKYSRFGRDRYGNAINMQRLQAAGGELQSATEEADATTASGRFQRGVLLEIAAFESERTGESWEETHQWRRDHGLPATGGKRFGYVWYPRKVYAPDGSITLQDERYEKDPQLVDVVEDLYERYLVGVGFASLAASLNKAGIETTRGTQWSDASLRVYMDSGFAAGYLRIHDPACTVKPYSSNCPAHLHVQHPETPHPRIIEEPLWQQYLKRRAFTKTAPPRSRAASYPLSALARCPLCSSAARHAARAPYVYLVCNTRSRKGLAACKGFPSVPAGAVLAEVLRWLQTIADGITEAAEDQRGIARKPAGQRSAAQRIAAAEEVLQKRERAVARHMKAYANCDEDDPDGSLEREYRAVLAELRAEKAEAVQALEAVRNPSAEDSQELARAAAVPVALDLLAQWDSLGVGAINAMLRQVIRRVEIGDGTIDIIPVWQAER